MLAWSVLSRNLRGILSVVLFTRNDNYFVVTRVYLSFFIGFHESTKLWTVCPLLCR